MAQVSRILVRIGAGFGAAFFLLVSAFFGLFYFAGENHPDGPANPVVMVVSVAAVAVATFFSFVAVVGREPFWVRRPKGSK